MKLDRLMINGRDYWLAASQDVDALKDDMVSAVRDGGDLVTFATAGDETVTELVTTGSAVKFTVVERPEATDSDWDYFTIFEHDDL